MGYLLSIRIKTNRKSSIRLAELFMVVDEKGNEFELTDKGITAWAEITGGSAEDFVMLDLRARICKNRSGDDL